MVDSEFGKKYGFTSDKFFEGSYLSKKNNVVYFSYIGDFDESIKNTLNLTERLLDNGFICKIIQRNVMHINELVPIKIDDEWMVPPCVDLQILKNLGFKKIKEYSPDFEEYFDVWVKNPERKKEKISNKRGAKDNFKRKN